MKIVLDAFLWVDTVSDSVSNALTQKSGLSEFNISVISSELDIFVPYTQSCICLLYYVRTCIFSLRRRTYMWWKNNF